MYDKNCKILDFSLPLSNVTTQFRTNLIRNGCKSWKPIFIRGELMTLHVVCIASSEETLKYSIDQDVHVADLQKFTSPTRNEHGLATFVKRFSEWSLVYSYELNADMLRVIITGK
jgi:hypothetical protein